MNMSPVGHIDVVSLSAAGARKFCTDALGVPAVNITRVVCVGKPDDSRYWVHGALAVRVYVRDLREVKS